MRNLITLLTLLVTSFSANALEKATFAGGCFWCMEPPFEKLVGVKTVISGFSGGKKTNPSYKEVASGKTTHREVVQVTFDPQIVSYKRLLEIYWQNVDPTDSKGQFVDRGFQYSPAIFFHNEEQKKIAKESKKLLQNIDKFKKKIIVPIIKYHNFYTAEENHQDYYKKNLFTKSKYKFYRSRSGRDDFLEKYWKENELIQKKGEKFVKNKKELKKKLTKLQYKVTQEDETERAFENKYWSEKREGLYVDIVSGEVLFSSKDKFKSGTGWPSFTKPLVTDNIIEVEDSTLGISRVEVRSRRGDSHLGHVFKDGPAPTKLRYCINSAALKFIPKNEFKKHNLEKWLKIF